MKTIPASRNEAFGFYGTVETMGLEPGTAWGLALRQICEATGGTVEGVRDFLDSKLGRHFADEVGNQLSGSDRLAEAISRSVAVHQRWRIDRRTARTEGIPLGLPYLAGWVAHFDILEEA
jgi:hypothetical protein